MRIYNYTTKIIPNSMMDSNWFYNLEGLIPEDDTVRLLSHILEGMDYTKVHIICNSPFPENILSEKDTEYHSLSDIAFEKKYLPIQHPLPDKDEGIRWVNLINHFELYTAEQMSYYIMDVNGRTINNFYQEVRRRISLLERPLVTARGYGRSYIYANYNPKYAQQIMTIFMTFYNFCWVKKMEL